MTAKDGTAASPMPPFTDSFRKAAEGYGLVWLPEGFPGVNKQGAVEPHPILGVYVLRDYLYQHALHPREELVDGIRRVARSAVDRMQRIGDALVFTYPPDPKNYARATHAHNSGLTQAYYALMLLRAARVTGDQAIEQAAHRCFRSLTLPFAAGGVLRETPWGPAIEEVPSEPPGFILNGWLSALEWLWRYGRAARSEEAADLLHSSFSTLLGMLPLYDVPEFLTSRYSLNGFAYVRLRFPSGSIRELQSVRLEVPHLTDYEVDSVVGASRWAPYLLEQDGTGPPGHFRPTGSSVRANLVFCRSSLTEGNRLSLGIEALAQHELHVEIQLGEYDPMLTSPARPKWCHLTTVPVNEGSSKVEVEVPPRSLDVIAYPTNCKKVLNGRQTNVYHGIHIDRLRTLSRALSSEEARWWADRWIHYAAEWTGKPIYEGCTAAVPEMKERDILGALDVAE